MPRRPRVHLDHAPLHIVQRGHNRDACFFNDDDRVHPYWLGEALPDTGCQLHAWGLMTNHVHLLLTPECAGGASSIILQVIDRRTPITPSACCEREVRSHLLF